MPEGGADCRQHQLFWVAYVAGLLAVLIYLFRTFLFSSGMLASGDVISGGVFFRSFLRQSVLATGHIPGWNPYICGGLPFVDAIHGGAYYPLTYLEIIGNVFRGYGYSFMLHFLLSAVFACLSARQLGMRRVSAALVGVAYGLSPCLVSWVAPGHDGKIYAATWFPLAVFFADRILKNRRLLDVAGLGLAIAIILLTPHLQMAYYVLWFLAGYALWKSLPNLSHGYDLIRKRAVGATLLLCLAVLLGLMISAVQLWPSGRYILTDTPRASAHKGTQFAGQFSLHTEELVSLVIPEFCGTSSRYGPRQYWGRNAFKDNSEATCAVVILLAFLAFVTKSGRDKYFWGISTLFVLLYAVGNATPVFSLLLALVPALDSMEAPSMACFIAIYSLSVLAGMAFDNLQERTSTKNFGGRLINLTLLAAPIFMVVLAVTVWLNGPQILAGYARLFRPDILPTPASTPIAFTKAIDYLPEITTGCVIAAISLIVTSACLWAVRQGVVKKWALWIIPALIALVYGRFDDRFISTVTPDSKFGRSAIIDSISSESQPWRVLDNGVGEGTMQLAYFRLSSTTGVQERIPSDYFELIGGTRRQNAFVERFANLTGTRYLIQSQDECAQPLHFGPLPLDTVISENGKVLLRNTNCFPRVFCVNRFQIILDRQKLVDSVLHGSVDLLRTVILEKQPKRLIDDSSAIAGDASILYFAGDSVVIRVKSSVDCMLVLTDNFHRGWHAFVDGTQADIYRADGTFRAVEVPANSKIVTYVYDAWDSTVGGTVSLTGVFIFVSLIAVDAALRIRGRRISVVLRT